MLVRHQIDGGYPGLGEMIEPVERGAICAAGRKRPDMNFRKYHFVPGPAGPLPAAPVVRG